MEKEVSYQVQPHQRIDYRTIALITSSLAIFSITFMITSLNVAIPIISREFNADVILLSWVVTGYILAVTVFSLPFGRLSDIFGIKRMFLYGAVMFGAGLIAASASNSATMLITSRVFLGIGAAAAVPNSLAMIIAIYPAKERGKALGLNTASVFIGSSIGPFLGGILTEHLGWRSIFMVCIPVLLIVIYLSIWKVKGEWCAEKGEKFDYKGSLVYGFALVALMFGFTLLPKIPGMLLILLGIAGLGGFIVWESRIPSPILNINAFKNNRTFIFSNLAALFVYAAIFALTFLLSLYLQYNRGFSPEQAGLIMVVQPVLQAALSPFMGKLSDRVEPRIVTSIGMVLICLGLITFALLTKDTPIIIVIIALAVFGIGFAFFASPNVNAIMSSVVPRFYGVASAMISTTRCIGQMLSMGITTVAMAAIIGRVVITQEYYPAYLNSAKIAFGIFAFLCFLGIFASLARGKLR